MRDMQTEILRGIEAFARGNFTRMHRIETSDADLGVSAGSQYSGLSVSLRYNAK